MRIAAVIACACALLACGVASAATTPAAYRAHVNRICRGYTPAVKKDAAAIAKAQRDKDAGALGYALGHLLGLALAEDKAVEAVPVPPALRAQMRPILALLRTVDAHIRKALSLVAANDTAGWAAELKLVGGMGPALNVSYDNAGLRDCGSNQG